ncbi:putrescine aminotransferase [Bradyrhizobium sp. AZCC 1678]|uniref:aspartate aminotransferase family protein n=1 Tax=Bradyrhizobium sp. AZCC 1678 TaxID=3117030 RepID=UPI002FF0FD70
MNASEVHQVLRSHGSTGRSFLFEVTGARDIEVSGAGAWVTVSSGLKYLDLGSYAVFLLGHRHPRVIGGVSAQLNTLPGSSRAFPNEALAAACAALTAVVPMKSPKVMLLNSGAEATEAAAKLARAATGRPLLLHLEKSYHGKTFGALSLTDAELFRRPFVPLLPFTQAVSRSDITAAVAAIRSSKPAAIFVEPVQGEGGVYEIAPEFLRALRSTCDETGTLLIFDEIQCGLGRCGTMWASQAAGVVPDILLSGKALGGGVMPVSAVVARTECFGPYDRDPIVHSSTFGGNPLAAAAVVSALEAIQSERIVQRAADLGAKIRTRLIDLASRWPTLFGHVSGRGLMLGLHCRRPDVSALLIRNCLRRQVLVTPCLTTPHVVRITPPAILTDDEVEFADQALEAAAHLTSQDL